MCAGLIVVAAASCEGGEGSGLRRPAVLRVPLPRDILTLDPADGDDINTFNVIRQIYEGLVDYDPRSLEVVPRVARSWTVSPDGLVWTFLIRDGVRFTDDPCFPSGQGRAVASEDVKFSIERGLGRFRLRGGSASLPSIVGMAAFLEGSVADLAGLEAPSPDVLIVRVERLEPRLLHFLVRSGCRVVPREAAETYRDEMKVHAVGTGPFRVVSWRPLSGILMVRNRRYWQTDGNGERLPYLDAIRMVPIWGLDRNRLYATGGLDVVSSERHPMELPKKPADTDPTPAGSEFSREPHFYVERLNTIYVRFDYRSGHPVVRDRRLRLAISHAVSRGGSAYLAAAGLLPPGLPGFERSGQGQRTDLAKAAGLLREAGHQGGRGLPEIRLAWRDWDSGIGTRLAENLRQLGLRVALRLYSDLEFAAAVGSGSADLFRSGWMADYPDPQNFLQLFHSRSAENTGAYDNPEYDRLLAQLQVETNAVLRRRLAGRLERILLDDTAAVFLHHERENQFVSQRVQGWEANCTNPLNICFYEHVRLLGAGGT